MRRPIVLLYVLGCSAAYVACGYSGGSRRDAGSGLSSGGSSASDAGQPDGSSPDASTLPDASMPDTSMPDASTPDAATDAAQDAPDDATLDADDAALDAASLTVITCKTILDATPGAPSGAYVIDVDGPGGPLPAVTAHCDMTFDGGGWTLLQSYPQTATGPGELLTPDSGVVDGGPDAAWYVQPPTPGALGGWSRWMAEALAAVSTQVHIRTPFSVDAGVDGGAYITSVVLPDGGVTAPVANLRAGKILNAGGDGGYSDWTGTFANAARLSFLTGCVDNALYPSLYWACNNLNGLHILHHAGMNYLEWDYANPTFGSPHDPFEAYVR